MGAYDSPGYQDRLPGEIRPMPSTGYPGSQATNVPTATTSYDTGGTTATSALITPSGGSLVNADRVPVGPLDSLTGLQADLYTGPDPNALTAGMSGDAVGHTGIGGGSYGHSHGAGAA